MRIKQLELSGFKSFRDRTVVELRQGVTAIVGPNGCGKSNVVDAIRWVLGEQSPKHLRGDAMEDVIFAGNADTGPLGMAEVSLLMERSDEDLLRAAEERAEGVGGGEQLPPELQRASEVLVTRRYFRSGESEYFINRVPCRLKDITELFLGTGVGTKAYAIIEQGRVEQLVNAKPEEMRLFIEEAAGTTRFRARKVAAERKMERTRDNLVRVQDVLSELERQMASLQRQARRAEEYHRIKGELRELDLRVMATRRQTWVAEATALGSAIVELQAEEATLHEELRRSQDASDVARAKRQETEARLRAVDAELTEQRVAAREAAARSDALATRYRELTERAAAARAEVAALEDRRTQLEALGERASADAARLTEELAMAESVRSAAEQRLAALAADGAPLELAVEEAKDAVVQAQAEEARLRNLVEALRRRREEIAGQRLRLEEEQAALGRRLEDNAAAREHVRRHIAELSEALRATETARAQHAERSRVLAEDEARAATILEGERRELTQLRSRADSLRELQTRYEGCTRGVASLLERAQGGAALLAGVLRVPAELERAVAAALGARLGQVVVTDTDAAVAAVRWLQESSGGSATVLPNDPERRATVIVPPGRRLVDAIEVDPAHWGLAEGLLGGVLLADDLDDALRQWRDAAHPATVVTLAGEAIDPLGAISGGSEPPLEETLLARARELRELDAAVAAVDARVQDAEIRLRTLRGDLSAVRSALAAEEERLQSLRLEQLGVDKDRERLEEEHARITAELEIGALEASGLAGTDEHVAEELSAYGTAHGAAVAAVDEHRAHLVSRQEALTTWRADYTQAEQVRTERAVEAVAAAGRHRAAQDEIARVRSALGEVSGRVTAVAESAAAADAGAAGAAAEAEETAARRAEAERRAAALDAERGELLAELERAEAAMTADDLDRRASHERLESVRAARGEREVAAAERRVALEQLAERLAERWDLGLEALDDVVVAEAEVVETDATRVDELRARLVRLGDVNPGALAELEEVRERHGFLANQRADLENSLEDLRQTIGKLTRASRQRFEETFYAANAKLATVFPKAFPEGQARLELVPGEDEDAEAGVEIVVQLPGKKLQSLSLLSGGEKALTATSLVFSLFMIRPTPFCLLDEVDAPLDEANIGRFNMLVDEMAETSQFVLITHNRRTMEVADTLYGITMEQAGVSKVVSVRLSEAA
ncbi:MAG: chromosome segregation protein SMC [bacterium]|nr:chromosome segregation protein SMC [bacterium]